MKLRRISSASNVSLSPGSGSGGSRERHRRLLPHPPGCLIKHPCVRARDCGGRVGIQRVRHRLEIVRQPEVVAVESADQRCLRERDSSVACSCWSPVCRMCVDPHPPIGEPLATAAVSSREPSSSTISSQSDRVWQRTDTIASPIVRALLYAAMTTLNAGDRFGRRVTAAGGRVSAHQPNTLPPGLGTAAMGRASIVRWRSAGNPSARSAPSSRTSDA